MMRRQHLSQLCVVAACLAVLAGSGCTAFAPRMRPSSGEPAVDVGRELEMVSLPRYVIEPPDILLVDALRIVPKAPFRIEPLDVLYLDVSGTGLDQVVRGLYPVEPGGTIDLGAGLGKVRVAGLSLDDATATVDRHLRRTLKDPQVSLTLAQSGGQQQIIGQKLVAMDGTVNLGVYGKVYIAGLTVDDATAALTKHLSQYLDDPVISVSVFAFNSKVFYIITEGGGQGDTVVRAPITGSETVLDAISQVNGLTRASSKNIWISRPSPNSDGCFQILPVNFMDITRGGATATNYQLLPGDRLFIEEDHLIAADSRIAKILAPFERVLGFTLLGSNVVQVNQRFPDGSATN